MGRILIFTLICVSAAYCGLCIFIATQPNPDDLIINQHRERLCPLLDGSDGTAAGNLFNQLCKDK